MSVFIIEKLLPKDSLHGGGELRSNEKHSYFSARATLLLINLDSWMHFLCVLTTSTKLATEIYAEKERKICFRLVSHPCLDLAQKQRGRIARLFQIVIVITGNTGECDAKCVGGYVSLLTTKQLHNFRDLNFLSQNRNTTVNVMNTFI